jgi:hypothetical protein
MRTEGKPLLNIRGAKTLPSATKDDISISKRVQMVSRFNGNFIDGMQE